MTEDEIRADRQRIVRTVHPMCRDMYSKMQRGVLVELHGASGEADVHDGTRESWDEVIDLMCGKRDRLRGVALALGVVNAAHMTKRQLVEAILTARRMDGWTG